MSNQEIVTTLQNNDIRTIGDLDSWARVRGFSLLEALGVLLGPEAAYQAWAALAVSIARQRTAERQTT